MNARRKVGVGTLILCLVTFGLWIFVIPLYRERCPICLGDALTDKTGSGALEPTVSASTAPVYQPSQQRSGGWAGRMGFWMGRHPVWSVVLVLFFIGSLGNAVRQQQSDSNKPQAPTSISVPQVQDVNLPKIPPPKVRVFKFKTDVPTTYVVPVDTTDEQLKSLVWLFRQKVRAGKFKDIGITQPTAKQFGQLGYTSGMLVVFRGEKCANEDCISDAQIAAGKLGPCGYGEHDDGGYQWGIDGDPLKDSGTIRARNGDLVEVFNYKDNWH